MSTRVALYGFGRVGRNIFRILYRRDDIRVVSVSDIMAAENLEYHLKFDTILGRFPDHISVAGEHLYAAGRPVRLIQEKPGAPVLPWGDLGVDVVVEASARRRTRAELEAHLAAGAKRVVLCSPTAEPPDRMVIPGISDHLLRPEDRIIANGSCTLQAVAPVVKLLDDAFGIERASLTVVHAYTNQQRLADVPAEDMRRGRAAAENIIPQASNAPDLLMSLLPQLAGKVTGLAMNVPVGDGSVVDLVASHREKVTVAGINEVIRTAASMDTWSRSLQFEDEPIVSSDVVRSPKSATYDSLATMVLGDRVSKTLTWFDNGWGFAHRAVELIERLSKFDVEVES